jgi:hypothetical protein
MVLLVFKKNLNYNCETQHLGIVAKVTWHPF